MTFLASALMIILPVFSAFTTSLTPMIPFTHFRAPVGLFGIGSLSQLYLLLSLIHGVRLYRRMSNMELEQNPEFEAPTLQNEWLPGMS